MADIIGKIEGIAGTGNALILRANGERVIAKPGDTLFMGDTVVTSDGSRATIGLSQNASQGVVSIDSACAAKFDDTLFDTIASLISQSSIDSPVTIGETPSSEIIDLFNNVFPDAGITQQTAEQESRSDQVVDDLATLPPAGQGGDTPPNTLLNPIAPFAPPLFPDPDETLPEIPRGEPDDQKPNFPSPNIPPPPPPPPELLKTEVTFLYNAIDDTVATTQNDDFNIGIMDLMAHDEVIRVAPDGTRTTVTPTPVNAGGGSSGGGSTGGGEIDPPDPGGPADTGPGLDPGPPDLIDPDPAMPGVLSQLKIQLAQETVVSTSVTTSESTSGTVYVESYSVTLSNGLVITFSLDSNTSEHGGEVKLDKDGNFFYDPSNGFTGRDSFSYTVETSAGQTESATVFVDVAFYVDADRVFSSDEFSIASVDDGGDLLDLKSVLIG